MRLRDRLAGLGYLGVYLAERSLELTPCHPQVFVRVAHGNIGLSLLGPGRPGTLATIINILIQGGDLRFQLRDALVDILNECIAACGIQVLVGPQLG